MRLSVFGYFGTIYRAHNSTHHAQRVKTPFATFPKRGDHAGTKKTEQGITADEWIANPGCASRKRLSLQSSFNRPRAEDEPDTPMPRQRNCETPSRGFGETKMRENGKEEHGCGV